MDTTLLSLSSVTQVVVSCHLSLGNGGSDIIVAAHANGTLGTRTLSQKMLRPPTMMTMMMMRRTRKM